MLDDFIATFNEYEEQRYHKMLRLRESGVDPYPLRTQRSHSAREAVEAFTRYGKLEGASLVGRLVSIRDMGKITFAHIKDGSGQIQLFFRRDQIGEKAYAALLKDYDLGDFIGAEGNLFKTKSGEVTLEVQRFGLLAKTLSPLPEKWHGLKDTETRYRQRYLDLLSNEEARRLFMTRAKVIGAMRAYLDAHGFLEVETPTLQPLYGGAFAEPFVTHHNKLDRDMYLRIATELYLKRLIVGGYERVYEIGKNFRNEGIDQLHNPEFTMMECYQAYGDYNTIMTLVEEMLGACAQAAIGSLKFTYQGNAIDLTPPWKRVTMHDAVLQATQIDIFRVADLPSLRSKIGELGLKVDPQPTWGKTVDEVMKTYVEPKLIQPTFMMDYPEEISPLAKKKPDQEGIVERFEPFIGGFEVGNAFTELNDPIDQYARFAEQARQRAAGDAEAQQLDMDFIQAMMHGMPPTGGLGIGVDRVVMLLTDQASIREVILFPQLRT
jgi:lysyl-tRNA synthetase, class II